MYMLSKKNELSCIKGRALVGDARSLLLFSGDLFGVDSYMS